jgi:hypothetical protein
MVSSQTAVPGGPDGHLAISGHLHDRPSKIVVALRVDTRNGGDRQIRGPPVRTWSFSQGRNVTFHGPERQESLDTGRGYDPDWARMAAFALWSKSLCAAAQANAKST